VAQSIMLCYVIRLKGSDIRMEGFRWGVIANQIFFCGGGGEIASKMGGRGSNSRGGGLD